MADLAEPGELYVTVNDKTGQQVTLFSSSGDLKGVEEFGAALKNHNAGKDTPGFIVKPVGGLNETIRKGLYQGTREMLPNAGEAVGGAIGLPNAGRNVADFIGQQFDTPGEVGMAIGTGAAGKLAKPIIGGAGQFLGSNLVGNIAKSAGLGLGGSTAAKLAMGEDQTISAASQELAAAALGGGLQGLVSYGVTKFLKPATATKVATEMMDTIKQKYPTLINDPNAFAIANSSPKDISNLTSMMSKALRGDADDEAANLVASLKTALPGQLTVAKQNTLRASARRIIDAQTKALDNIGDEEAFNSAAPLIEQRRDELLQTVRELYPKSKKIDPAIMKVEAALSAHKDYVETFKEGAMMLHHLKATGSAEKFDPMVFAQRIKGTYTEDPGSLMNQIGKILGQGRSLKEMPMPGEPEPGGNFARKSWNLAREMVPFMGKVTAPLKVPGATTPWPAPKGTGTAANFAAQEAGQAAMKDFMSRGKK